MARFWVEQHAYVVVAAAAVVVVVVVFVGVAVAVAFVWQTNDCDLVRKSHLRHQNRTIQNWCRMESVMGTVVIELLALG